MIESIPLIFWDGERLFRMRSLAKRRRRHIRGFVGVIKSYQKIVMDQEIQLVTLRVEACLRAGEFKELRTENQDLCDRLNGYETERW